MKRTEEFALMSVERRGVVSDVPSPFLPHRHGQLCSRGCCHRGKYVDRSFNIFPSLDSLRGSIRRRSVTGAMLHLGISLAKIGPSSFLFFVKIHLSSTKNCTHRCLSLSAYGKRDRLPNARLTETSIKSRLRSRHIVDICKSHSTLHLFAVEKLPSPRRDYPNIVLHENSRIIHLTESRKKSCNVLKRTTSLDVANMLCYSTYKR